MKNIRFVFIYTEFKIYDISFGEFTGIFENFLKDAPSPIMN